MTVFVLKDETHLEQRLVAELLCYAPALNSWERKFLMSVAEWKGNYTIRQAKTIVLMHAKHFPEKYKSRGSRQNCLTSRLRQ